jgi:GNAT superfamily N-acetyltransferase
MRLAIRELTASDAEAVAQARVQGWRHAYAGLVPQQVLDGMDAEAFAAGLRGALLDMPPQHVHLVADLEGEGVVGWTCFGPYRPVEEIGDEAREPGAPWGELYAIYVLPALIGRGLGRALMGAALDGLAAQGHGRARLWVLRGNAPSRRFYERAGFAPDGAANVLEMAGEPVTEVRYARSLP